MGLPPGTGLEQTTGRAILQTWGGFLWIACHTGLTCFDGLHGDLWLGTATGVFRISPRLLEQPGDPRVTVYHLGSGGDDAVWRVRFGHDGTLRAGTRRGLYRWNGASDFSPVVSGFMVNRIEEARDGHILTPNSKGYVEWDGVRALEHQEVVKQLGIAPDQVFQGFPDRQAALWFSTAQGANQIGGKLEVWSGHRD